MALRLVPLVLVCACATTTALDVTWNDRMLVVDEQMSTLERVLLGSPQGDLATAAATAEAAANTLRLGYGELEDRSVPGFGLHARQAEAWLLEIALEAQQAHGDLAADLFRRGRKQHCGDCHDAYDRAKK